MPIRLTAEFAGTLFLLATVVGSGIMAENLASGNAAIALLGNTLATGAMLAVLITVLAPLSGAHINPAVSIAFWLRKDLTTTLLLAYITVHVLGGICGAWLAHYMFELDIVQLSEKPRAGLAQCVAEGTATFGLVATIFGTLRVRPTAVAPMVGLYIAAAYWFTSSTSFANPAVTVARSLTDTFSGIAPTYVLGFVVFQVIGAVLAVGLFHLLDAKSTQSSTPTE